MSIREGFEWTEVEPPVEGGERCRAEGRLAVTGKRKERQRGRMQGLFIDSHVRTNKSLSRAPPAPPHAAFHPRHD